uniref:Ion transport domain-containing protein n=1 Tax=Alexandrium monilatum TaxID=311494 RepID=A0A7S4REK2_9DINO
MVPPGLEQRPSGRRAGGRDGEGSSDSEEDAEGQEEPLELLEEWKLSQRQLERLQKGVGSSETLSRCSGSRSSRSGPESEEADFKGPGSKHWSMIHPHSHKRAAWDIASLILVIYDMIMIPMSAFNLPETSFLLLMDWTTRLFWTFDMGWSALTGVVLQDGKITFEIRFILKRYLKTWFALDCIIVGSDWMEVIISSTNLIGLGRLARAFRIARVVRLLRLVRMQEVLQSVTERVQSDKLTFLLGCAKLVLSVLAAAHVVACAWWGLGDRDAAGGTWVSAAPPLGAANVALQYLVSLHWALCQFTGGMDEVAPANALERLCAVASWTFGFVASAAVRSAMTSDLTHLHIIGGAQARQLATLRRYLKQNGISRNLALRVQRSAQHAVTGDLAADSVELLGVVAEPLRVEMNFEMYSPTLRNHPLFSDWIHEDAQVIRRVCHLALVTSLLANADVVFGRGETPRDPKMYFVVKGLLEYCRRHKPVLVGERQWLSEGALWTPWTHRGTLTATTDVTMATLHSASFRDVVQRFKGRKCFDPRLYAAEFVNHVNRTPNADDLTFMT